MINCPTNNTENPFRLLILSLCRQFLPVLIERDHHRAGNRRLHHSGSHTLKQPRYAFLLHSAPCIIPYAIHTAHNAERRQRLARTHLLLRFHDIKRIHKERC